MNWQACSQGFAQYVLAHQQISPYIDQMSFLRHPCTMSASQTQSDEIEQINCAIAQMHEITQQNATLVEQA
ncbi:MAG: hypothetical protein V4448_04485 [Pseudomonadota bacterium]